MHARSAATVQGALAACAAGAAVVYGAPWLGLGWDYQVSVNGATFALGSAVFLSLLAAVLMGWAAGTTRGQRDGRAGLGALLLGLGGGAIFASFLWIVLVWGPLGAHPAQYELLRDVARMGFAMLALGVPLAMPTSAPAAARLGATGIGVLLVPMVLFPHNAAAAGLSDVEGTLPMLLFFLQAMLAFSGAVDADGRIAQKLRRGRSRRADAAEPEVALLRARAGRGAAHRQGRPPMAFEALRNAPPAGPGGPGGPRHPLLERRARAPWFFQF